MKVSEMKPVAAGVVAGGWEVGEMFPVGCTYGIADTGDLVVFWPTADLWDDELGGYCPLTVTREDGTVMAFLRDDCNGMLHNVNEALALMDEPDAWGDLGI